MFGIGVHKKRNAAADWRVASHLGRMRCTGVGGGITGRGADLLIIDDPIKDAVEAGSATYRDRAWNWYGSTARTRLEPGGIIIVVQTRWHQEDLIGRLRQQEELGGEAWDSLTLPGICEDSESDPLGRSKGQALWPQRYPEEELLTLKNSTPERWWNAMFQQRPAPPGGLIAKSAWFDPVHGPPINMPMKRCRFWDCAGTVEETSDPDWTVGAKLARDQNGIFYIEDIIRVRMRGADVDALIRQTAEVDTRACLVREEQEGGSSGKAIIEHRQRKLAGFNYQGIPSHKGKELRWQPMLNQAEIGCVKMVIGPWNEKWLSELREAPFGSHDDQLDAVSGSFQELTVAGTGVSASKVLSRGTPDESLGDVVNRRIF